VAEFEEQFEEVSGPEREAREKLADAAREDLTLAGLPVRDGPEGPGAEFEVDFGDDDAGGVWVSWNPDERWTRASSESMLAGRLDDPVIERSGRVTEIMRDAMIAILAQAGYAVEPSDDDMRPLALRVNAGPSPLA
jgi:hypothetical protein